MSMQELRQKSEVNCIKIEMDRREKELLGALDMVKQQLASAKEEARQLTKEVKTLEKHKSIAKSGSWKQEAESLQIVVEMRKQEMDKLKAANNSLNLELERLGVVHLQLQVERQKTEDMSEVICVKNDEMHHMLDEFEVLQHELEIEVASHLACQQELEKIQWERGDYGSETYSDSKQCSDKHK